MRPHQKLRSSLLLVLTALIWGVAFVAQSTGGDAVGPATFNCIRFLIGGATLLPVIVLSDRKRKTAETPGNRQKKRCLLLGGVGCGVVLAVASLLQQLGIYYGTAAGKAGFLTSCYILLVPLLGLFFRKTCGPKVWVGVVLAIGGLYLLCVNGRLSLQYSDGLVLLCAACFSVHILLVDHFSPLVDGVRMSAIQFFTAGVLCAVPMVCLEMGHTVPRLRAWAAAFGSPEAWIAILYAGVMSCGVAYTLQILGQRGLNPTLASLLMSLESVFSVLAGWLLLQETMTGKELGGCALIFAAIVLAQLPSGRHQKN